MKKSETIFVCQSCSFQSAKWLGKCPECGEWNALVEERARKPSRNGFAVRDITAVAFNDIEPQHDLRISSGVTEFDRVLGGGIVPGTLVLIGGDPGIGKSTLLLQVADQLSGASTVVLYVSGEESERQIKLRGDRLGVTAKNLYLLPETNLEKIFHEIDRLNPGAVIVDSIQTVFSSALEAAPGSISQVREVAHQFLLLAKNRGVPVFLIGHINKEGSIAGPKRWNTSSIRCCTSKASVITTIVSCAPRRTASVRRMKSACLR
jgi:DNA repair protein RadA/Sms